MSGIIFIGDYHENKIKKLDNILELYEKIRENKVFTPEEVQLFQFKMPQNTFKINGFTYKEATHTRMRIIDWFDKLRELNFNTHLDHYDCSHNYEDITCYDESDDIDYPEKMINWKVEIDNFIYKDPNERCFKIGIEAKGIHTYNKESENKKLDKCKILFYIGDFMIENTIKTVGYNLNPERDSIKIVERITNKIQETIEDPKELADYFIKYSKITTLGRKIMTILIKIYLEKVLYYSSYFLEE
jgi:hypothetical protein